MTFSRQSLKVLAIVSWSVALAACIPKTKDRPDGLNNDAANFAVASVGGSIGGSRNVGDFPLPGEKVYNYKACLIDYTRRTSIPNAKFWIKEIDREVTTDANGCLNWPETVKFNYLADSIWLKQTRTFEARGLQRGAREVKFAINPWSHGESVADVKDLMKETVESDQILENENDVKNRLAGLDKDGKSKVRNIWVESGESIVSNVKQAGAAVTWHDRIYLKPQINFGKMDGTPVPVPLANGSFKVEVTLILEDVINQKTVRQPKAQQVVPKVTMQNNTLMVDVDFSLDKIPGAGQTFMGIKLVPLGAPEGLQAFEGVFPLGGQSFIQSAGLKVSENVAVENAKGAAFTLQKFLGVDPSASISGIVGSLNVPGASSAEGSHDVNASVEVGLLSIDHYEIEKEQGSKKTFKVRLTAPVSSRVQGIGVSNLNFEIQTQGPDGQVLDVQKPKNIANTTKLNELYWDILLPEIDRYECGHYLPITVQLKNDDIGVNQKATLFINPWTYNLESFDSRKSKGENVLLSCKDKSDDPYKIDSVINIGTVTITKNEYRPHVLDRTLKLTMGGKYFIRLNGPTFRDYSDPHSGAEGSVHTLPANPYLLRLVFVRSAETKADNGYVAHADVIMYADGGNLDGEFELTIKDLQATMAKKVMLAQLYPIDLKKFQAKKWKSNDPGLEDLIDPEPKLISPLYGTKLMVLGSAIQTLPLMKAFDAVSTVKGISSAVVAGAEAESGASAKPRSSTLLPEIIKVGQAAQAAAIAKSTFNESDANTWLKWSQKQNLSLVWLSNPKSVQFLQSQFGLQGDAKAALQGLIDLNTLDAKWGSQFCQILADGPWKTLIQKTPDFITQRGLPDNRALFLNKCQEMVRTNPSAFIKKTTVYRLLDSQEAKLLPLNTPVMGLSISSGFGYSSGHTEMEGSQGGISLSGGASGGMYGGQVGLQASAGTVMIQTNDHNRHSGNDLGGSVSFGVTRWQFEIPTSRYQKCTMLRADPSVFKYENRPGFWEGMLPRMFTDHTAFSLRQYIDTRYMYQPYLQNNPMFRGWLICSDQVSTTPIKLHEDYFAVTQEKGDTETYDSLDEINRHFFMYARGLAEFARFKGNLSSLLNYPENGEFDDEARKDLAAQVSPLIRQLDAAPGMVLYDPSFTEVPDYSGGKLTWGPLK